VDYPVGIEGQGLLAARRGPTPESGVVGSLRVIEKLAVRRFKAFKPSLRRQVHSIDVRVIDQLGEGQSVAARRGDRILNAGTDCLHQFRLPARRADPPQAADAAPFRGEDDLFPTYFPVPYFPVCLSCLLAIFCFVPAALAQYRFDSWVKHYVLHPPPGLLERLDLHAPYLDITALYEDREGNLWIGTQRRGLYRVRKQVIMTYSKQHGLVDNNVYPIYEDRAGAVWIGAWYTGLSRFKDGKFINYTKRDGLASNLVTAIGEDQAGRLWVAAFGDAEHSGLRVFEGFKNGRFTVFNNLKALNGQVSVIYQGRGQDREVALWFGTEHGLAQYKDGAIIIRTTKDGLAGNEVKVIIEGAAGNLWIGCYGGISRFKDGKLTTWTERDGLASNNVRALYEDGEGALWIGTYDGGLGRLKDGRFTRYTTKQGLFNDGVFQILEDSRGYFWMGCNRGIYRVSKQELNEFAEGTRQTITSIAYGRSDGLLNPECNGGRWPAGVKSRDGKLWFPTQDGVAVIDPEAIPTNSQPPPVVIESFLLDRAPVAFDRPVQIAPSQENFEIEYTALSFINSEHIRFKYKLEGLDHDWIDVGIRRTAYYSHVPPGRYTFKVIAANSDGVWNTEGRSLSVVVLPPFYRTWWFISLATLGVAGAVFLGYEYRIRQLKRAQGAQQAFARQLIASQEHERKRIAAELHDSLGQSLAIIKNRALLSLSTPEDHDRALEQLREISEAAAQVIVETKEIAHNLRPYQLDRLGLTKTIKGMVERVAETHPLRFALDLDRIDGLFPPEAEINLFRIVQESVNNIIEHAEATEASVLIKRNERRVAVTIRDNGKGFVSGAPKTASLTPRRGFGLIGIAERVRLLGGDYDIQSVPGQGTRVTISISLNSLKDSQT